MQISYVIQNDSQDGKTRRTKYEIIPVKQKLKKISVIIFFMNDVQLIQHNY